MPVFGNRNMKLLGGFESQPEGFNRAALIAGETNIKCDTLFSKEFTGFFGFFDALGGQADIMKSCKPVLFIPL